MPDTEKRRHFFVWLVLLITPPALLSGCYDYHSISSGITNPVNQSNTSFSDLPSSATSQQSSPSPQGPSQLESEAENKAALAVKNCTDHFPESPGHKTELVRCIVSATDEIWDRAFPQGSEQRHSLGSYAIQLAEREDRGEITREQAENLYMQFLQQTPGLGVPPKPAN